MHAAHSPQPISVVMPSRMRGAGVNLEFAELVVARRGPVIQRLGNAS
jgi:hypothetical protein